MAVIWLELSVNILVHINSISKGMESIAVIPVLVDHFHCDRVHTNFKQVPIKYNGAISKIASNISCDHWLVIDHKISNISTEEIDEDWLLAWRWHSHQFEMNRGFSKVESSFRQRK